MRRAGVAIPVEERNAEFTLGALQDAARAGRVSLDDLAYVHKGPDGKVEIRQTKDVTPKKGAVKGGLVGAVIGLAAPPLLGAAVVGAGAGALWGRLRDKGLDDKRMKAFVEPLEAGEGMVFALGDDASIDAIADKVEELSDGKTATLRFDAGDEAALREMAVEIPRRDELSPRIR